MTTLFVTSSGTGLGKTFVTLRLFDELHAAGYRVRALKPVASGFDRANPEGSDTDLLLRAQDLAMNDANLDAVSPWRFAAPVSPDMAAAREGRSISFADLVSFCRAPTSVDVTLIEGVGGVMVPLDAEHTVLDWLAALAAPAVLVVGSYLGALSHSLTAIETLRGRGLAVASIVISESPEQPVPVDETAATLRRFVQHIDVTIVCRNAARGAPPLLPLVAPYLGARQTPY